MKKIALFALVFIGYVNFCSGEIYIPPQPIPPLPPNFHIAAFMSCPRERGLKELMDSASRVNIPFDILYSEVTAKSILKSMLAYMKCNDFHPDDIVMFIDRNRTLFVSDVEPLLRRFFNMQKSFVISATRKKPRCYTNKELYESLLLKEESPFSWPSPFGFIGRIDAVTHILTRILAKAEKNPRLKLDALFVSDFFANRVDYKIDIQATIFLSVAHIHHKSLFYRDKTPLLRVKLQRKNFFPKVVHAEEGSKGNDALLSSIYLTLFSFNS